MLRRHAGVRPFLYMDDRSLLASSTPEALQDAIHDTCWSDARLQLREHTGKRQLWSRTQPAVEHLGLTLCHNLPPLPAVRSTSDSLVAPCKRRCCFAWCPRHSRDLGQRLALAPPAVGGAACSQQPSVDPVPGGVKAGCGPTTFIGTPCSPPPCGVCSLP